MRRRVGERMISACVVPTVVKHGGLGMILWGCFAGDTVSDFRIQRTLLHASRCILQRYHPIWFALSGTIICFSTGQWLNTPQGCVRAEPQSEGKAANKCSAYVGTPPRLLEKHSRWWWLSECQACAKVSSRQRVATLNNLKYEIYFDLFNNLFGYYMIPYVS